MAKSSSSTAYPCKEKLALDLLEQIKNGADFGKLANTPFAHQANAAVI